MKQVNIKFYTSVTDEEIKNFIYSKLDKDHITLSIEIPKRSPKHEYPI